MQVPPRPVRKGTKLLELERDVARKVFSLSPPQITLLGFAAVILLGAFLLWLPFSVAAGHAPSFLTALFIATSAVCVTGLVTVDPGTYFSLPGQVIIMLLIQIGGLGYMTMYSLMLLAVGRRLSLRDRLALQEVLDRPGPGGVARFVLTVVIATAALELAGFAFLATRFVPELGWGQGLYFSLFHAISSFNNAGFALFPDNMIRYKGDLVIILSLGTMVFLGGIGFPVLNELWQRLINPRKYLIWRHMSLNTRVALSHSVALLAIGMALILLLEAPNEKTLANLSTQERLLSAWFQSVIARTAGFNSIDIGALGSTTAFLITILMFIGASPGGTGGGIKTTSLAAMGATLRAVVRGEDAVVIGGRQLPTTLLYKAMSVIILSGLLVVSVATVLSFTEGKDFLRLLFEATSAFATVGLSMNLTPELTAFGQLLIIFTMYAGRVGMLTIVMALYPQRRRSMVKYAPESLLVG